MSFGELIRLGWIDGGKECVVAMAVSGVFKVGSGGATVLDDCTSPALLASAACCSKVKRWQGPLKP